MHSGNNSNAGEAHDVSVSELWYAARPAGAPDSVTYRPAVFVDASINFRSIKAGVNNTEERTFTAWLPDGDLPIDWDVPAVNPLDPDLLASTPDPNVAPYAGRVALGAERLAEIETDLLDTLVRRERFTLLYNPLFEIFSGVGELSDDFVARTAETALAELEPELKKLKNVFELRLEQVRESQRRRGGGARGGSDEEEEDSGAGKAEIERLLQRRTEFFQAENRLASLFTGKADFVLRLPSLRPRNLTAAPGSTAELREDLVRLEHEASDALTELYARYIDMVRSYDEFEIRVQPGNVRLLRRALLWVPIA